MAKFESLKVPVNWTRKGEKRLDARYYAEEMMSAQLVIDKLEKNGVEIIKIGELYNDIFWPGRIKRNYSSEKNGRPFLMPSEVFMFLPKPEKYVINFPKSLIVKKNWLLLTRSGTIGRCILITNYLSNMVVSDDLIRIVPNRNQNIGYLLAYLNTWVGQAFLTKNQYGATVKHIEPHHVANIPIPRIPDIENKIDKMIDTAQQLREDAQSLLLKAEELIYSELSLPRILKDKAIYFGGETGIITKTFHINASELHQRLDASYHAPIIQMLKNNLIKSNHEILKLGDLLEDIFIPNRFKRAYVDNPQIGVPFLQGADVPKLKPLNVKYLWGRMENIEKAMLGKHWILMTRSGTVGRLGFVGDSLATWAASEHILRLIPKNNIHPGFLMAFLYSSYGYHQIIGKVYGAVVDEIAEKDTSLIEDIDVVFPSKHIRDMIGETVLDAFSKKEQANIIENNATTLCEDKFKSIV